MLNHAIATYHHGFAAHVSKHRAQPPCGYVAPFMPCSAATASSNNYSRDDGREDQ